MLVRAILKMPQERDNPQWTFSLPLGSLGQHEWKLDVTHTCMILLVKDNESDKTQTRRSKVVGKSKKGEHLKAGPVLSLSKQKALAL